MTNHRTRRTLRAALCLVGCAAILLTGCAQGAEPDEAATPPASAEPDVARPTAKTTATTSAPDAASPPAGSSPTSSAPAPAPPLSAPEDRPHPAYADIAPTLPTSTFTGPIYAEATQAMREIPSTPGAVGTAAVYVAAFRDAVVSRDPTLIRSLALPECTACASFAGWIETQPAWSEDAELTTVIWVLDFVEDSDGRTLVTVGVETIRSEPDPADDAQIIAESTRFLWDIQLEPTLDGWAVRAVATGPWT